MHSSLLERSGHRAWEGIEAGVNGSPRYRDTGARSLARRMQCICMQAKGHRGCPWGGRFVMSVSPGGSVPLRNIRKDPNMLHDAKNLRRATTRVIRRQPGLAALPRTMAVLLSAWLVYFFAVNLFVKQLNAVTVPYLDAPLGAYLVALGAVLVFAAAVYFLTRAIGSTGRRA